MSAFQESFCGCGNTDAPACNHAPGRVQLRLGKGRRERLYSLTDIGRAQLIQAEPYWELAQQRLREQLGATGWSQTYDCLNRLAASAMLSLAARRKNVISLDKSLSQD